MLSCEKVTKLVSESMDKELAFREKVGVRLHLAMCRFCKNFSEQLIFIRKICNLYQWAIDEDVAFGEKNLLSLEYKEKIKQSFGKKEG